MILITTLQTYANAFKTILNFDTVLLVAREEQLQKYIKDIEQGKPFGVMVIPASMGNGQNEDNYTELSTLLFYFLEKVDDKNNTPQEYLDILSALQIKIENLRDTLIESIDDCSHTLYALGNNLDLKSFHIDPEYNYLGCHGWSISYKVRD